MRNPPAAFKHVNPTYANFSKSGDSSLLRKGFAAGGEVDGDDDFYKAGQDAYKNLYADLAAPKTQGIADWKAKESKAKGEGLSNMEDKP